MFTSIQIALLEIILSIKVTGYETRFKTSLLHQKE